MANTVRSQATALEIPVTIQGSKTVQGTEQRELFTETTKTTLVFENGAVVKLNARVSPGQCVFLRNDQSEREILCKVLESRQAGQTGYTDLEFTSYDPKFWDAPAEKAAPAAKKPTAQDRLEAAAKSPIAGPVTESNAPSNGKIPAQAEQLAGAEQKSETQKKIDAAVQNLAAKPSVQSSAPTSAENVFPVDQPAPSAQTPEAQKTIEPAVANPVATPNTESSAPSSAEIPVPEEQPAPSAQTPEAQKTIEPAVANPFATPSAQTSAPSSAEIPATFLEPAPPPKTTGTLVASASPIILEAPHESLAHLAKHEPTDEELDWNAVKDAEMLAALATMEAGSQANREPGAKETGREGASAKAQGIGETDPDAGAAAEAKALSKAAARAGNKLREFTTVEKPVVIGIAAGFLLAASLALFWQMKSALSSPSSSRPVVAASTSSQPKQTAPSVSAPASQTSASGTGANAGVINAGATSPQASSAQQSAATATQKPGASVAQNPTATTGVGGGAPPSKGVQDSPAVAAAKLAAARGELTRADQEVLGLTTHRKANGNGDDVPARIVSQAAPAMPTWAQGTEMDHVVTLDALIDEKGNLVETKPLSGSHLLWPEAQRAVAIWVFAPAMTAGKPTSSRIVLTVQFQK
jgi:hypothetical protein